MLHRVATVTQITLQKKKKRLPLPVNSLPDQDKLPPGPVLMP